MHTFFQYLNSMQQVSTKWPAYLYTIKQLNHNKRKLGNSHNLAKPTNYTASFPTGVTFSWEQPPEGIKLFIQMNGTTKKQHLCSPDNKTSTDIKSNWYCHGWRREQHLIITPPHLIPSAFSQRRHNRETFLPWDPEYPTHNEGRNLCYQRKWQNFDSQKEKQPVTTTLIWD